MTDWEAEIMGMSLGSPDRRSRLSRPLARPARAGKAGGLLPAGFVRRRESRLFLRQAGPPARNLVDLVPLTRSGTSVRAHRRSRSKSRNRSETGARIERN